MVKKLKSVDYTNIRKNIIVITIFGIAMGFLETVVVVYLRQLYYPEGFMFPLKLMPTQVTIIEYIREISTIIMLSCVGAIAGTNFLEKFSYFVYCFGIWDIFYYIWLKVLINWPSSLLTWDILFLIPVVWVGPVLAPVICSIIMIILAVCVLYFKGKGHSVSMTLCEWLLMLIGAFIIFCTFIWDYSKLIIKGGFISNIWTLGTNGDFQQLISQYVPTHYNWYLFIIGGIFILCSLWLFCRRLKMFQPPN